MIPEFTLVFFAVRTEARPFQRRLAPNAPIQVRLCGMGKANARSAVLRELATARPAQVLTCGFAGGLDPGLAHNQVLFQAAAGSPLADRLRTAGATPGRFHCADRILITPQEKAAMFAATRADAAEMESEAIHQACAIEGVPCATVRVISDTAAEALPLDFNRLADAAWRLSYPRLLLTLARNPGKVRPLLRFQAGLGPAAQRLGIVLQKALAPG
jgi:nucleoside phosphorylase